VNVWLNAAGYQAAWIAATAGAARGWWWAGPAAALAFATWQLAASRERRADALLVCGAAAIGFAVDSAFARSELIGYAAAVPWPGLAPVWIVALWMCFALTLNHSLAYLKRHALAGAALGAVGAPLAYSAAAGLGALVLAEPESALAALAVVWALVVPLLARAALALSPSAGDLVYGAVR